jgi:anaerobic ribonucleoside-triphosphate reductase activating protein
MLKYLYFTITTREIPSYISLTIQITGCPIHCKDCHSPHTWDKDLGTDLTKEELIKLIESQKYIDCVLFFGGEWNKEYLIELLQVTKQYNKELKTALYTGRTLEWINKEYKAVLSFLDYIKVGEYNKLLGSLEYPSTNQRLYKIRRNNLEDITYKFWRTNIR